MKFKDFLNEKTETSTSLEDLLKNHMDEYKKRAEERATQFVKSKIAELEKANWCIDDVAPRPNSRSGSYKEELAAYNILVAITTYAQATRRYGEKEYRKRSEQNEQKFIKHSVDEAEHSYLAFIKKLKTKIGKEIKKATLDGSIWTNALLTVETVDGETQRWNTNIIINFSKYGKMFNQFPTRKQK